MFDIGQNDIAGAFYSKTFDQIVASFPLILTEFETGIKVSFSYYTKHGVLNHFLFKFHLHLFISTTRNLGLCGLPFRDYMTMELGIFGYTTPVPLDA